MHEMLLWVGGSLDTSTVASAPIAHLNERAVSGATPAIAASDRPPTRRRVSRADVGVGHADVLRLSPRVAAAQIRVSEERAALVVQHTPPSGPYIGFEVSHWDWNSWVQNQQEPQAMGKGTTTRSQRRRRDPEDHVFRLFNARIRPVLPPNAPLPRHHGRGGRARRVDAAGAGRRGSCARSRRARVAPARRAARRSMHATPPMIGAVRKIRNIISNDSHAIRLMLPLTYTVSAPRSPSRHAKNGPATFLAPNQISGMSKHRVASGDTGKSHWRTGRVLHGNSRPLSLLTIWE